MQRLPSLESCKRPEAGLGSRSVANLCPDPSHSRSVDIADRLSSMTSNTSDAPKVISPKVISLGVAVHDLVFSMDAIPTKPHKYRAKSLALIGGGCAATASVAVARLGGRSELISRLGNDFTADMIIRDLQEDGVHCAGIKRYEGFNSPLSAVVVDDAGERMIIGYRDHSIPTDAGFVADYFDPTAKAVLADSRWADGAMRLFELAQEAGIPSIYDGEMPFDATARKAALMADYPAFSSTGIRDFSGEDSLAAGVLKASAERDGRWTVATGGEEGLYVAEGGQLFHMNGFHVEVVDTLGAGDVWHGAFALAIAERQDITSALNFASASAALKCTHFGGRDGTPTRAEVAAFLTDNTLSLEPIAP